MVFYPILGWGIFWISFVVAIILYSIYRKLYTVIYLISVALYIITAGFMIDAFELGRFGILTTLVVSAILFMLLGYCFSQVLDLKRTSR